MFLNRAVLFRRASTVFLKQRQIFPIISDFFKANEGRTHMLYAVLKMFMGLYFKFWLALLGVFF